tara:strand:+ start:206 stop:916 length:711 start_codon:yes stop_codon:yes gene_type:complete
MSLDHIQEELDEIYNFDYKFSVMKLFTINDKGAMFARSIGGIGEALKGFILQFRHENKKNAELTEENDKLKEENKNLKEAIQDKNALLLKWGDEEKENKELKEENKKLEEKVESQHSELCSVLHSNGLMKYKTDNMSMKEMLCNVVAEKIDYDMSVDVYGQVDLNFHNTDIPQHIDIMKNIIKILTEHHNGDSQYSSYKNGFYYYKGNCFMKYILDYNPDVSCLTYNEVEDSDEED